MTYLMKEYGPAVTWWNLVKPYVEVARPDHWFKNIFVLPGVVAAFFITSASFDIGLLLKLALGIVATCLAASANYSINEYLDAEFDRLHPRKKLRPAALGLIKGRYLVLEYMLLIAGALLFGSMISKIFVGWISLLLVMGVIYNVKPFRSKDRPYVDVLSESINNPIRFMLGWHIVAGPMFVPSSILIAYWMGGAFLMAMKRYAEVRSIGNREIAGMYRQSFKYYTEESLLVSSFFYAILSAFFIGIFLIKYRIEFLICFPLLSILFAWYLKISLKENSSAQSPEKLYREKGFVRFCGVLILAFFVALFVDIPALEILTVPLHY